MLFGNDNSKVKLSINILKYLNALNSRKNEYYFLNVDRTNKLNKLITKNLIKIKFSIFEKKLKKNEYDWLNIDLLGKILIDINMRECADIGKSYIDFFSQSKTSNEILRIVKLLIKKIKD